MVDNSNTYGSVLSQKQSNKMVKLKAIKLDSNIYNIQIPVS